MFEPETIIPKITKNTIYELAKEGKRLDGRAPTQYREITIKRGVFGKAEGSAQANIGNTMVVAGVKLELGEPYPDSPDKGILIVSAEFLPLASPVFMPGPPDERDIELSRIVDRGIRSSECIDLESLCLIEGKKVWTLFLDIYVLGHDGNPFDAAMLAAVAALQNTIMPETEIVDEEKVKILEEKKPLPLKNMPVSITMAKVGDVLLVDPCLEEEQVMECRLTIIVDKNGNITGVQKGGSQGLTYDEVVKAIEISRKTADKLRQLLEAE